MSERANMTMLFIALSTNFSGVLESGCLKVSGVFKQAQGSSLLCVCLSVSAALSSILYARSFTWVVIKINFTITCVFVHILLCSVIVTLLLWVCVCVSV